LQYFFGVVAPNSNLGTLLNVSQRGKNSPELANKESSQPYKTSHARRMGWVQRLKRVFNIDITECEK